MLTATMICDVETIGQRIRRLRDSRGWSLDRLSLESGIRRDAIWKIEDGRVRRPQGGTLESLSKAFTIPIADLIETLPPPANNILPDFERHYGEPANIQHAPKQIPSIPEWTAEIACGHWIDCAAIAMDMDNDVQADTARRGMFIVRVMGDSMKPTYKPGNRVLFRVVRLDDEPLRIGADYYWQNSDGQCTLKRLKSIGEDEYTLAPLNRKYKPLNLAKQMLAKVAIVETIVTAPWE